MDYQPVLDTIAARHREILGDNLVGVYVHGSIAFGCFHWESSDIDWVTVVEHPLTGEQKLAMLEVLVRLWDQAPPKGFETSVVLLRHCQSFIHPCPYELHFSAAWLDRYHKDPTSLCDNKQKTDPDLAAHFTVIRHTGVVLYGRPVYEVFGEIKEEYYLDSIIGDIRNARADISQYPVYIILNLCRVAAYIKDHLILSKAQGGRWGEQNLPDRYRELISGALKNYETQASMSFDADRASEFSDYMLRLIQ